VRATSVGELAKLLTKFGQLVIEKDFCRRPSVDKPRAEAIDDRTGASVSVDRAAVRIGAPTGETPSNLAPMRLIDE